jgi:hypothetical protein
VKLRILVYSLALAASVSGQRRSFSWQNACFNNPGAPYCQGHEFAVKKTKPGAATEGAAEAIDRFVPVIPENVTPSVIAMGGLYWQFADPKADALAGLNFSNLQASPLALGLMTQLGAKQGLTEADMQAVFEGFSSVDHVVICIKGDQTVLLAGGRVANTTLPPLEPGWKAVTIAGNGMIIGPREAVDQAVERVVSGSPAGELARLAKQKQTDNDFFAVASGGFAGAKRFSVTASLRDRLSTDTAFEFSTAPDEKTLQMLPGAQVDGNVAHVGLAMGADEVQQHVDQIASSPLGKCLGALVKIARYLPTQDSKRASY